MGLLGALDPPPQPINFIYLWRSKRLSVLLTIREKEYHNVQQKTRIKSRQSLSSGGYLGSPRIIEKF